MSSLALFGGKHVSERRIPIARPSFSGKTIDDVSGVIRSGLIREGPKVKEFEERFQEKVGSRHAYTVSSGTAALHTAYLSILKPQD